MPRSKPVAIDIPSIGVHSSLLSLGVNADNTVQVPLGPGYDQAGWYRFSPTPGSLGPAVILGHVSGPRGSSVFFELGRLRPDDRVKVARRDGSVAIFEVTLVRRYPRHRFPSELVYGNTDHPALRLITCGGLFDSTTVITWTTWSCSPHSSPPSRPTTVPSRTPPWLDPPTTLRMTGWRAPPAHHAPDPGKRCPAST
jgi:hypothetical protein